jgi:hypothetical protein
MSFFQQGSGRTQVDRERSQDRADKLLAEADRRREEREVAEPRPRRVAEFLHRLRRSSADPD